MPDPTAITEEIIWTALPNGVVASGGARTLRLSVLVSPRLKNGATLDRFPDFIDWPRTLEGVTFVAHLGATSVVENQGLRRVPAADSNLWRALFTDATFVRSHTFDDYSTRSIHSYPVLNVLGFIQDQYTRIGIASPLELPPTASLGEQGSFGQIEIPAAARAARQKDLRKRVAVAPVHALPASPRSASSPPDDFLQVDLFHTTNPAATHRLPVALPEIDFHQMVSLLGEYPEVLRLMGLVIDFTIDLPVGATATGDLSVEAIWTPAASTIAVTPHTVLDANGAFIAAPRDPLTTDLTHRFLALRSDKFGVVQVDVDGAAIKAMNFANLLVQAAQRTTPDTPTVASVPSLRSGGLSIVRTGRAVALGNRFKDTLALNKGVTRNEVPLFAEDIVRGFRVDVRELTNGAPGEWLSLCRRDAVHNFTDVNQAVAFNDVEGIASMGVMQKPLTLGDDFLLHESMFRWAGWSLCVAPPLASVPADQTVVITTGSKPPFGLKSGFTLVADSLPVLRFGRVYQFRVRTVDLAGNSDDRSATTDDATVTDPTDGFYARFEPVSAPVIVPRRDLHLSPGESVERLVVRSNEGLTPEEYLTTLPRFETSPSGGPGAFPDFHATDYHAACGASHRAAKNRRGHGGDARHVRRHVCHPNQRGKQADRQRSSSRAAGGSRRPLPARPARRRRVFFAVTRNEIELSDPDGSSSTLQPFLDDVVNQVAFTVPGDRWPDVRAFRLHVVGIPQDTEPAKPDFNRATRVLTVQVPQAAIARFRVSSFLASPANLDVMGIWRWIAEGIEKQPGSVLSQTENLIVARGLALNGLHWMVAPFREIVAVHAVQQPLLEPDFVLLTPLRLPGTTFATFEGVTRCDGKSTSQVDVLADWEEPLDDPADAAGPHCATGPQPPIQHKAHAFAFPLNFPGPITADAPIVLTDGSRRIAEYADGDHALIFTNQTTNENLPRHEFGDTKYHRVAYTAVATTRFREYFPCAIAADEANITRRSPQALRHIPSSARPDAPKVLYVIPTFGWERSPREGAVVKSARRGGGLRVYLDRPWFSSGDGEMLGVVLFTEPLPDNEDRLSQIKPYITRWGLDPIWTQTSLSSNLEPRNFTRAKVLDPAESKTTRLTLEELGFDQSFSVAPHEVAYDEVRRLWFCDIDIDPGVAYFPFVRLALARYQPRSVDDFYLSRVVLADFAQLTPDRSASVAFEDNGRIKITVSGRAFAESSEGVENLVTATVQERTNVDPDLGWTAVANLSVRLRRGHAEAVKLNFWSGELSLPDNRQPGATRLLIQEWEVYASDAPDPHPESTAFHQRLVYAEALPL